MRASFIWQLPSLRGDDGLTKTLGYVVND
jgi:hypothetical protein